MCEALGKTMESFISLLQHEPMDCVSHRLRAPKKDPVLGEGWGVSYFSIEAYRTLNAWKESAGSSPRPGSQSPHGGWEEVVLGRY